MTGYWWNNGGANSPAATPVAEGQPIVVIPAKAEGTFDTTSDAIYKAGETPWFSRAKLNTNSRLYIEWHSRQFHFGEAGFIAYFPNFYVNEDGKKNYMFSPYPFDESGGDIPASDIASWVIEQMNTNTPSITNPTGGKPVTRKFVSKYVGVKGKGSAYHPPVIGQDASKNSKLCYLTSGGLNLQGMSFDPINVWGSPLFVTNFKSGARLAVGNPLWRGPGTTGYINPQVMLYVEYQEGGASIA